MTSLGAVYTAVPSWSELGKKYAPLDAGVDAAVGRRAGVTRASGPTNSQASLRLFGTRESDLRVVLYRDNHAWCPYCHKVWLQLEEKQIPYKIVKINMRCYGQKPRSYLKRVPSGLLPAIEIDGVFYTESDRIMRLLEAKFPENNPLLPPDGTEAGRAAAGMLKLERALFSRWLNWLCSGSGDKRNRILFVEALDEVNRVLGVFEGPFFLGSELSMVDCVFAPFLERIAASIVYYKGLRVRDGIWQNLNTWFMAMEERPTYRGTQSDYYTHVHDLPPQLGGCAENGSPAQVAAAGELNGTSEGAWQLPLPPILSPSDVVEPPPGSLVEGWQEVPELDRAEAAGAMLRHQAVLQGVALRSGKMAGGAAKEAVDVSFRLVCHLLLQGSQVGGDRDGDAAAAGVAPPPADGVAPLLPEGITADDSCRVEAARCLRYVRDRVGVPRDMSTLAARQLRAHLNTVAASLDPAQHGEPPAITTRDRGDQDSAPFH